MPTRFVRASLFAVVLTVLASVTASAAPMLTITILPAPVVGAPGETVNVFVDISNSGDVDVAEFIGVSGSGDSAVGEFDGTSSDLFLLSVPALPVGSATGQLLLGTFTFASSAAAGTFATFTVDIDYLFGDSSEVGWADSQFRATAVPEPTTLALVGLGMVVAARRRGRRA